MKDLKQKTIETLREILAKTKLSERAGKYEALDRANWLHKTGRGMIESLINELEK